MAEPWVELETVTLRSEAAPHLLGCGLVFLAAVTALGLLGPWLLAADGELLQAAALLLMAVVPAAAALADGPGRAARGFVAWVLGCLGARRCLAVGERAGRRALRLDVRFGERRFALHEVGLDAVLAATATTLQGGGAALHLEWTEDELFEPCLASEAQAHAATVTRWLGDARASAGARPGPRCAICHAPDDGELLAACPACATRFHAACEVELGGRCPTLGCARTVAPELVELDRLEVALPAQPLGPRAFTFVWLALSGLAAALLARGLLGLAPRYELVQGAALGSITLLPLALALLGQRLRFVQELLSAFVGAGRRTLALDRSTTPPMLTIGWRAGPLRLPLERVALDPTATLEVAPLTEGWRVRLGGPRQARVADGIGLASAQRIAAFLRLAPSTSAPPDKAASKSVRASER